MIVDDYQKRPMRRMTVLGAPPEDFAIGERRTIKIITQIPICVERLIIPPSVCPNFLIRQIRIGTDIQFMDTGAIPAAAFSSDAEGMAASFDRAAQGVEISIDVERVYHNSPGWLVRKIRSWLWLSNDQFCSRDKLTPFMASFIGTTVS